MLTLAQGQLSTPPKRELWGRTELGKIAPCALLTLDLP
jgi:hypothetical protein